MTQLALPAACRHEGCAIGRPCDFGMAGHYTRRGQRIEMVRRVRPKRAERVSVPREEPRGPEEFELPVSREYGKRWRIQMAAEAARRGR